MEEDGRGVAAGRAETGAWGSTARADGSRKRVGGRVGGSRGSRRALEKEVDPRGFRGKELSKYRNLTKKQPWQLFGRVVILFDKNQGPTVPPQRVISSG